MKDQRQSEQLRAIIPKRGTGQLNLLQAFVRLTDKERGLLNAVQHF